MGVGIEFQVLGSLVVRRDAVTVPLGSRQQRALLVRLLVDAGSVVSVDALAHGLWGDEPPADPRNAVQTYVARLRERLGEPELLVTRHPGYSLEVAADQVDALRFERLVADAQRHLDDPAEACALLEEALGLWRGPAYAGFADGVAHAEAVRLEEERLVALEGLAAARLALGEARQLIGVLEALVSTHPLRERFVALHMRALAAVDRQADALEVYRSYRQRLTDETGLEPSPSIRDLEMRIVRGEPTTAPAPAPDTSGGRSSARPAADDPAPTAPRPTAPRPATPGPVPGPATTLVGRQQEIAHVLRALGDHRIVTVAGTGGVGKTRVGAEVVATLEQDGDHEVAWVELASVGDADAVAHVVATALGIDLGGAPSPGRLVDALVSRRLLLALDNAEHLLEPVAALVDELRARCPDVRVLVTSRERLAVEGECVVALSPLSTEGATDDDAPADAVRLFLERAVEAGGEQHLAEELPTVMEICRELDGLPLAIELAAARTLALGPSDLLAALRDDARAAVGARRGRADRHRDLWAVVDWSYRLLDDEEQRLFERLGVFAGTFGIEEARAVGAPDDGSTVNTAVLVAALAERSLVATSPPRGPAARYRLLRPLRAFARQRLADRGELAVTADRHTADVLQRVEGAGGPPLREVGRIWLESSLDDLREVRRRLVAAQDVERLSRLVAALYRFDYLRPGAELLGWADDLVELEALAELPTAPQVHGAAAAAAWRRGDLERAARLAHRGTQLGAGADDPARIVAFEALGDAATFAGRLSDAEAAFREQARLARLAEQREPEAMGLASLALVLAYADRVRDAVEVAEAAEAMATSAAGSSEVVGPGARAFVQYALGETLVDDDPHRALPLVERAAEVARAHGAWFVDGVARVTAASLHARHGAPETALPVFADLIGHWQRSGSWPQLWTTLRNLSELLGRMGADEPAVVLAAAADADRTAAAAFGAASDRLSETVAAARERLGDSAVDEARDRGARLTVHEVAAFALDTIDSALDRRSAARSART